MANIQCTTSAVQYNANANGEVHKSGYEFLLLQPNIYLKKEKQQKKLCNTGMVKLVFFLMAANEVAIIL